MRKKDFYKMKQVIVDYIPFEVSPQQINESMSKNGGRLVVKGVLQRAEAKNQNAGYNKSAPSFQAVRLTAASAEYSLVDVIIRCDGGHSQY